MKDKTTDKITDEFKEMNSNCARCGYQKRFHNLDELPIYDTRLDGSRILVCEGFQKEKEKLNTQQTKPIGDTIGGEMPSTNNLSQFDTKDKTAENFCFNCGKSLLTEEEQEYQEELKKFKTFTRIGYCIDCNDKAVPKTTQWGNYIVSGYAFPQDKEKLEQDSHNLVDSAVKTPCPIQITDVKVVDDDMVKDMLKTPCLDYPTTGEYVEETPNTNLVDNSNKLVVPCLGDEKKYIRGEGHYYPEEELKQAIKRLIDRCPMLRIIPYKEVLEEIMGSDLVNG